MTQEIVGSNEPDSVAEQIKPSSKLYGQNGFDHASSDVPGENTRSGFLPGPSSAPLNSQLRKVNATPLPTTFGQAGRRSRSV